MELGSNFPKGGLEFTDSDEDSEIEFVGMPPMIQKKNEEYKQLNENTLNMQSTDTN